MYVDSEPTSMYTEAQGRKMPSHSPSPRPPQPAGSLKRPPLLSQGSSSSSLSGMEQAVPSFQGFVSRVPPPDNLKPLPPTPLIPRRASSVSPPRSRTPSQYSRRRSSSVYSRTVSQWSDDDYSWRSVDLRDDPLPDMPHLPILQPVAYSQSTPQLVERRAVPSPPHSEPRTYSPLIISPSPTASKATTPSRSPMPSPISSPLRQPHTPAMYPTSRPPHDTPQKKAQTISLQQAKAAINSPEAVHLLPEELRAQSLGNLRSREPIRVPTLNFFENTTPLELPPPPTLIDTQEHYRSFQGAGGNLDARVEYPFPVIQGPVLPSERPAQIETRAPLENQTRETSKAKAAQALGLEGDEEPRGRTRQRGPRSNDYSHYMPKPKRGHRSPSPDDDKSDAQKIASDYHDLLSDQYRQASQSPACNSDDSVRTHMKMVPQPLFKNKPAAKLPGSISAPDSARGSNTSESAFHLRADSTSSQATGRSQGSFPMQLSATPDQTHDRISTTGSIPISPPMNMASSSPAYTEGSSVSDNSSKKSRSRRRSQDDRVSMYYPYVGSRKGKKAKEKKAIETQRPAPSMPLLSADIIAQRLKTPDGSAGSSLLSSTPPASVKTSIIGPKNRRESNASSGRQRTPLRPRLANKVMRHVDNITSPSSHSETRTHHLQSSGSPIASPRSPHLLPSPVKRNPPPVHLGWSDTAKSTFDRARSSTQAAKYSAPPVGEAQQSALIRPPMEKLHPDSDATVRKGSILGGWLDGWKERKREEKREELKRIIHVVPQGPPKGMRTVDVARPAATRTVTVGPGVSMNGQDGGGSRNGIPLSQGLRRQVSAFGWM